MNKLVGSEPVGVPEFSTAVCGTYPDKNESNGKAITGTWVPSGAFDGKCTGVVFWGWF
jgi:hypothetical protein